MAVTVKSAHEIAIMREAGRIVAMVLGKLAGEAQPGVKTRDLDSIAEEELRRHGARSSFKGYHGFPATLCTSINDEIVHGIPGDRVLKDGDILSLDFGAIYHGYHGDAAISVGIGRLSPQAALLLKVTEDSLYNGISAARNGGHLGDISAAIQSCAESRGFSVVREYSGHGIGKQMHEDPLVPNFGPAGVAMPLKSGMTLAIEPMVNAGGWMTRVSRDKWTVVTADGSLSAHFEHTIAITDGDAEILTRAG